MRLLATIIAFQMLFSTFFNLGMWVDYQVNLKEYKAKCENQDKPDLKCDGKCHLKDMFQVEEKSNSTENIPVPILESFTEVFVYFENIDELVFNKSQHFLLHNAQYFFSLSVNEHFDLFVPPKI